jgi:murein DD-endopeptidase MepM/ murein hydrolase activator NlpD
MLSGVLRFTARKHTPHNRNPFRLRYLGVALLGLFVAAMTVVAWPLPATPAKNTASPMTVKDLEKLRRTVDQYRSGMTEQRQRLKSLEDAARDRLQGLEKNVQITAVQLTQNESNLQQANQVLSKLEADLTAAIQKYEQKLQFTVARLRFLQRRPQQNVWAVLLASRTFDQFLDRRAQLQRVYLADQKLLVGLKTASDRLQAQKQQVEFQKQQIVLLGNQLQAQKAEYEKQAKTQQALVDQVSSDRQSIEAAEDQLQQDSEKITALIQQRLAYAPGRPGDVFKYGSGRLSYPTVAPITSAFGWRVHPVLGSSRFHAGTDFGAEYGTTIRAAGAGVVIFAGWYGGYGNAVIIDHGSGMTTLYAHSSKLYVQEGQTIQQGQAIAAVGSTGLSTGPHLHFEVRINGKPQDPMAYL